MEASSDNKQIFNLNFRLTSLHAQGLKSLEEPGNQEYCSRIFITCINI
jgi:hypothetical protein